MKGLAKRSQYMLVARYFILLNFLKVFESIISSVMTPILCSVLIESPILKCYWNSEAQRVKIFCQFPIIEETGM